MSVKKRTKKRANFAPCQTCLTIRLFLIAVFCIASLTLIGSRSTEVLRGMTPMSVAIAFVSAIAFLAIGKVLLEFAGERNGERS